MTPDEHAAEAERITTAVRSREWDGLRTAEQALALAQIHATLATRAASLAEYGDVMTKVMAARPAPVEYTAELTDGPTPAGYQRATTTTGYAIWQHQLDADGEPCMQVKSSRYFPSNRLSANGEAPPEYCACQGRDTRTDPGTWLPVYTPTTET